MLGRRENPPPGWISANGVLEPASQVAAFAARGQVVRGRCESKECARKVRIDPNDLCGKGQGLLKMRQIEQLHRCQRLDGCSLIFYADPSTPPLHLEWLTGRANVRIRLRCRGAGCKFARVWVVETMIEGLKKAGKGHGGTEVQALGKLMTQPCPVCRKVNWTADVLWANTETAAWRQSGAETYFSGMEVGSDV